MENKKKLYYRNLIIKNLFSVEDVMQLENISYTDVINDIIRYKEDKTVYQTKEDKTVTNTKDVRKAKSSNKDKNVKRTKTSSKGNIKNKKKNATTRSKK